MGMKEMFNEMKT
jgi:hypothetical protein